MGKKRVAVIGVGFIGRAHIDALRRIGEVEIVAVCESNRNAAGIEQLCIPERFYDYREMIDKLHPDAVHITTPNIYHYEIAKYALMHGVNVLCEKPFTTTIAEAQELVELKKEKGLNGAVNFHNRFYPMANQMKHMIGDGVLGDIISVTGSYQQDWLLYPTDFNWRILSRNSGCTRIVGDIGSHWMDLVQFVTGKKIESVLSEMICRYPERILRKPDGTEEHVSVDTEDAAAILFRLEGGSIGSGFFTAMFAGKKNKTFLSVAGTKCSAEWDSEDLNNLWIGHREKANEVLTKDPGLLGEETRGLSVYPGGHIEGFPDAFRNSFLDFYRDMNNPGGETEHATFEDGLKEMIINQAIYDSSQQKRWADIK